MQMFQLQTLTFHNCSKSVGKELEVLLQMCQHYHQCNSIPCQTVCEEFCQLAVSVRDVNSFIRLFSCAQLSYAITWQQEFRWVIDDDLIFSLPSTIKLLLMLFASSKVFPSLLVFLVISLPARSTKLIFPCRVMYTP